MNPVSAIDLSEVVGVIARWETKWKELERTEGVRLPDMVKMAALTELCPPDIRDLIFQTVDSGLKFDTMKEKVIFPGPATRLRRGKKCQSPWTSVG